MAENASRGDMLSGARQKIVLANPTITAGAYTANDALGGLMTFAGAAAFDGGSGMVVAVRLLIANPTPAAPGIDLHLFNRAVTPAADNAAASFTVADLDDGAWCGFVPVRSNDWMSAAATNLVAAYKETRVPFHCASGSKDIFGAMVDVDGATYGATDDLEVVLTVLQD